MSHESQERPGTTRHAHFPCWRNSQERLVVHTSHVDETTRNDSSCTLPMLTKQPGTTRRAHFPSWRNNQERLVVHTSHVDETPRNDLLCTPPVLTKQPGTTCHAHFPCWTERLAKTPTKLPKTIKQEKCTKDNDLTLTEFDYFGGFFRLLRKVYRVIMWSKKYCKS